MTTALTTGYAFPIPPLATGGITDGYATLLQEADDHIKGDVNTLSGIVTTMSGVVTTLSGNVTTLSGSLTTLSGNVTTLSGNVTTLSASLTTTSGYVTTLSGGVSTLSNYITTAWTDYSATSTIVGWSSFTSKIIKYKKVGTTVFINYSLAGNSDSATTSFTLPYTSVTQASGIISYTVDNTTESTPGRAALPASSSTVTFYLPLTGSWTAAGVKAIQGQFSYEVAL